jgi:predicted ATPase
LSLSKEINQLNNEKFNLLIELEEIKNTKQKIKSKEAEMNVFSETFKAVFDKYNILPNEVISYQFNYTKIDTLLFEKETKLNQIKVKLGELPAESNEYISLTKQLSDKNNDLKLIQDSLNDVAKKYQSFLTAKKTWEENKRRIIGNENNINSLSFLERELKYISTELVIEISKARESRFEIVKSIFNNMKTILDIYKDVKTKIDSIISTNENTLNQYRINIDASFTFKYNFQSKFLSHISLNKSGTFYGKENGEIQINKLVEGTNLDDFDQLKNLLSNITESFFYDKRNNNKTYIDNQVDNIIELYDYLFSLEFIDFNYQLRQGNKNLEQLSPGEKGALLLIFYLLLDNNDIPLIIDQPEDNLDNNSVANILVPFIKKAKLKRQIILVTHNPNLAVVADAEQVIYVHLEKEKDNLFRFISGSIENREVNDCIVKVLEGAMPAFNKRKQKYYE